MEKTVFAASLLYLIPVLSSESLQKLPAPKNVKIQSYNLKQLLIWDPPSKDHWDNAMLTYAVQHNTISYEEFIAIKCTDVTKTECDFTNAFPFGWRVVLRVQANLGQLESDWVYTPQFQATRDTVVGPVTSLQVAPEYGSLFISYSAPFKGTPEEWHLEYKLCYWKEKTTEDKICNITRKTIHTLQDVDPWTMYCIEVEPMYLTSAGKRKGENSGVICKATEATAATRAGYIALILFLSMSAVFFMGLGCFFLIHRFYKDIKHWFNPPFKIPLHIEEYLHDNFQNTFVHKLEPDDDAEDHCDKLSFVSSEETI